MKQMFSPEQMGQDQLTILPDSGQFINVHSANPKLSQIASHEVMIPMQFTGLKDKNDQEIYEGDIVGWFRPSDGVEVEFRNGAFGIEYFSEWIILGINAQHFAEVLGNIYEHPHLLDE